VFNKEKKRNPNIEEKAPKVPILVEAVVKGTNKLGKLEAPGRRRAMWSKKGEESTEEKTTGDWLKKKVFWWGRGKEVTWLGGIHGEGRSDPRLENGERGDLGDCIHALG